MESSIRLYILTCLQLVYQLSHVVKMKMMAELLQVLLSFTTLLLSVCYQFTECATKKMKLLAAEAKEST